MHRQTDPNTGAELNWPDAGRNLNDDKVFGGMNTTLVKEVCTNPVDRIGIDTYGNPISYTVAGVESWCQTCVHPIDFTVDTLTQKYVWDEIVAAMTGLDWITMAFAAFIVAFTITGELKDIEMCTLATTHAVDKLTPAWRIVLALLSGLRRWVFLPSMLSSIPALVLTKGGDSLSICLNTVAILFITDFDNMAYAFGLGERLRSEVEQAARVELSDAELTALSQTKRVHIGLIVLYLLFGVVGHDVSGGWSVSPPTPTIPLLFGAIAESFVGGSDGADGCRRSLVNVGAAFSGIIVIFVGFYLAAPWESM